MQYSCICFNTAVKKGRYSYEKRAETIIQSRSYWQNKFEGNDMVDLPAHPPQAQYVESVNDLPDTYMEQVPGTSMQYTEVANIPVGYIEEGAAPMVAYEEEVPATSPEMDSVQAYNWNNTEPPTLSKKSLREVLGMADHREQNDDVNEAALTSGIPLAQHPPSINPNTSQQNIWAGENSHVYTNLQPVPYTVPSQGNANGNGNSQIAPSPGALSDDSGVYLLSPNNLPACSPNMNSIPPTSPYKTVTISEPQTQAKIVEVVPGKVRSINMRREMIIDGKPVSYLLEGVLVAPSPVSSVSGTAEVRTSDSTSDSTSQHAYEVNSIADEMSIDGKPIAVLLQNILDDINEGEFDKNGTSTIANTSMPFADIDQDCAVNQVMIDGKPIYQMFEMFSQRNQVAKNEMASLPSIGTLTQKQQPAALNTVPFPVVQLTTSTQSYNATTQASTSYALPAGAGGSPTLTDIQETAQTLINMASMPMDSAITLTVSADDLQSVFIPDSTTLVDPDEANNSSDPNLTHYKPNMGSGAFINALISDNNSNSGVEFEKILQEGLTTSSMEDIKILDKLIENIYTNAEKHKCVSKEFIENLPVIEQKFLVSNPIVHYIFFSNLH